MIFSPHKSLLHIGSPVPRHDSLAIIGCLTLSDPHSIKYRGRVHEVYNN